MTRRCVTDEQIGKLFRKYHELTRRVDEGSVPFGATLDGLQKLIEGHVAPKVSPAEAEFTLEYDPGVSRKFLIDAGNYTEVEDFVLYGGLYDIGLDSTRLLSSGESPYRAGSLRVELIRREGFREGFAIESEIDGRGFYPATLSVLLTFGAQFPSCKRRFSTVALGSFAPRAGGGRHYPYLRERPAHTPFGERVGKRCLGVALHCKNSSWDQNIRFLVIPKDQAILRAA